MQHTTWIVQARGCLSVAGPAPPPLKDWSFAPNRYLQYLADLHHVHTALEASLQEVTGAAGEAATSPPTRALACMGPASGLHRAAAVADDTKAFLGSLSKDSMAAASTSEASAKPAASGGDGRWDSAPPPGPGAMAKSYAGYITRLAREAAAANNSQVRTDENSETRMRLRQQHASCSSHTCILEGGLLTLCAVWRVVDSRCSCMHSD